MPARAARAQRAECDARAECTARADCAARAECTTRAECTARAKRSECTAGFFSSLNRGVIFAVVVLNF